MFPEDSYTRSNSAVEGTAPVHRLSPEDPWEDGMRTGTFRQEDSRLGKENQAWGRGNYGYVCWDRD